VLDKPQGRPVAAVVTLYLDGELYARGKTGAAAPHENANGPLRFEIPGNQTYEVEIETPESTRIHKTLEPSDEEDQKVTLFASEE